MELHHHQTSGAVRWRVCAAVLGASAVIALLVTHALTAGSARVGLAGDVHVPVRILTATTGTAREAGASHKASGWQAAASGKDASADRFRWSKAALQWQRTAFHFQPKKNYMNDPNGPVYYRGLYHFFYQYNPKGAVWGNIAWGHAVSQDLVRWRHLPLAMVPDHWYDINGVLTGSITILPNGTVVLLYTGNTNTLEQVQCLALPADPSDPLLRSWIKHPANPVIFRPPGVGKKDFRDPTTAWFDKSDNTWRTLIGSKDDHGHAGIAIMYKTKDFVKYERIPGVVHRVEGTGMWECVDLYHVGAGNNSSGKPLYVMKASMDDERHDYYALGTYNAPANTWTPMDPEADVGIGLRYNWGKFFASTTFYDPVKRRRVLWGYVGETDSTPTDAIKGWSSVQAIPRTVELDEKTRTNLIQWPVQEFDTLRHNVSYHSGITIGAGFVSPLHLGQTAQLDIEASFRLDASAVAALNEADVLYNCSTSGGAANRGALGPFGLLIHADVGRREQTAVYFYVSKDLNWGLRIHFCHDESRSSLARDVVKRVVGSIVPVLEGEAFSVRVLVDHSIVESFAMGGRLTATSRVYPTKAIYAAGGVYVFNNATGSTVTVEKLVVHEMGSSSI